MDIRSVKHLILGVMTAALLAGCTAQYRNHGYAPDEADLSAIISGVDTRDSVIETLGSPSALSPTGDGDIFYVSKRVRHFAYMEPKIIERQVVAIRFDGNGTVNNVERFTLQDGRVVPLSRRVTSSSVKDLPFLQQLLGDLGRFDAGALLGG